ncbi:alanine/glycine:cation symporter family protein [Verrucomicrobiota bacterium]
MDTLARWIWDPVLSLVYVEIGVIFVIITGALAWRKSLWVAFRIVRSDKSDYGNGAIPHTKALISSIAATVGIGNLAGVATAIHLGGPGALFWMWMSALFGMSFKMASTYFAIKDGPSDSRSPLFATPMAYLEKHVTHRWRFIPATVAGLILIKGLVLANLVQSNSVAHALHNRWDIPNIATSTVLTCFIAVVILGGLRRIVDYTAAIAPWMMVLYVVAGLFILLGDPLRTVNSLGQVFYYAFRPYSIMGGLAGVAVLRSMQFGISRGIFSHMSGEGVGPFLQATNREEPAIGAFMAAVTPFVDTIIICTVTGLVIISGSLWQVETGAYLTSESFESGLGLTGQAVVIACLIVFAFTTISAFAHISERCYQYLGGKRILNYRLVFLLVTFMGPLLKLTFVWSLSDVIIAMLVVCHLLPLLYITLRRSRDLSRDLTEFSA